jgi:hypothetical protein
MQSLINCSITQKFMCALTHLNKGNACGSDHINMIVLVYPCMGNNPSHTLWILQLFWHKGFQRHPQMTCKHNPSHNVTERNPRVRHQGTMRARTLVHQGQSISQEMHHQEMSAHVSPVLGHANMLNDEYWQFFKLWHHIQLHWRITHVLDSDLMRSVRGSLVNPSMPNDL